MAGYGAWRTTVAVALSTGSSPGIDSISPRLSTAGAGNPRRPAAHCELVAAPGSRWGPHPRAVLYADAPRGVSRPGIRSGCPDSVDLGNDRVGVGTERPARRSESRPGCARTGRSDRASSRRRPSTSDWRARMCGSSATSAIEYTGAIAASAASNAAITSVDGRGRRPRSARCRPAPRGAAAAALERREPRVAADTEQLHQPRCATDSADADTAIHRPSRAPVGPTRDRVGDAAAEPRLLVARGGPTRCAADPSATASCRGG